jgi:Putative auto-transporter adhesin, head GIN domain
MKRLLALTILGALVFNAQAQTNDLNLPVGSFSKLNVNGSLKVDVQNNAPRSNVRFSGNQALFKYFNAQVKNKTLYLSLRPNFLTYNPQPVTVYTSHQLTDINLSGRSIVSVKQATGPLTVSARDRSELTIHGQAVNLQHATIGDSATVSIDPLQTNHLTLDHRSSGLVTLNGQVKLHRHSGFGPLVINGINETLKPHTVKKTSVFKFLKNPHRFALLGTSTFKNPDIRITQNQINQPINLPHFSAINIQGNLNVQGTRDATNDTLIFSGSQAALKDFRAYVKRDTLYLIMKSHYLPKRSASIKIRARNIKKIEVNGTQPVTITHLSGPLSVTARGNTQLYLSGHLIDLQQLTVTDHAQVTIDSIQTENPRIKHNSSGRVVLNGHLKIPYLVHTGRGPLIINGVYKKSNHRTLQESLQPLSRHVLQSAQAVLEKISYQPTYIEPNKESKQTIQLKHFSFKNLDAQGPFRIYINNQSDPGIGISGNSNDLANIRASVQNKTLYLRMARTYLFSNPKPIIVTINTPELHNMDVTVPYLQANNLHGAVTVNARGNGRMELTGKDLILRLTTDDSVGVTVNGITPSQVSLYHNSDGPVQLKGKIVLRLLVHRGNGPLTLNNKSLLQPKQRSALGSALKRTTLEIRKAGSKLSKFTQTNLKNPFNNCNIGHSVKRHITTTYKKLNQFVPIKKTRPTQKKFVKDKRIEVGSFSAIEVDGRSNVIIKNQIGPGVYFTGNQNELTVQVRGNTLYASMRPSKEDPGTLYINARTLNRLTFKDTQSVHAEDLTGPLSVVAEGNSKIYLTGHDIDLQALDVKGGASLKIQGINSHALHVATYHAGTVQLDHINANYLTLNGLNQGKIILTGRADTLEATLKQSTWLRANHLCVRRGFIKTYDQARSDVRTSDVLAALAGDCSHIYYYQDALWKSIYTQASGSVLYVKPAYC